MPRKEGKRLTAEAALVALRGVWLPIRQSFEGRLTEPEVTRPPGSDPTWMTIVDDTFHVTSAAKHYRAGGRLRVDPVTRRLKYVYPASPLRFDTVSVYDLTGDELQVVSGGMPWSGPLDAVCATEFRRVAAEPPADLLELIASGQKSWDWPGYPRE